MTGGLRLQKFDALGNDFLIAFVDELPTDTDAARSAAVWCDRNGGVGGADGLIYAVLDSGAAGFEVRMRLWNSDGSAAAVSGNGLRCLAHAVARERGEDDLDLVVQTPAGRRACRVEATQQPDIVIGRGQMGHIEPGPAPDVHTAEVSRVLEGLLGAGAVRCWETRRLGNPHIVVEVAAPKLVPLREAGPAVEALFSDGINVHFSAVTGEDELSVRVWERGAGVTQACGTGAVAAASVFHDWGRVGQYVRVRMPGGDLDVDLSGPVTLKGPSKYVGEASACDPRVPAVRAPELQAARPPAAPSQGTDD